MHTKAIKMKRGGVARVHHNSDWSGEAYVSWRDKGRHHEVKIPCDVLLALGKVAALDLVHSKVIGCIDRLSIPGVEYDRGDSEGG